MELTFKRGEFQTFRVLDKSIHLGQYSLDLMAHTELEFDGSTLKYGGDTYNLPSLAGAIRSGWMVPVEDTTTTQAVPQSAGVKLRPAKSVGDKRGESFSVEKVANDEQEVGSLDETKARREAARDNAAYQNRDAVQKAQSQTSQRPKSPQSVEPPPGKESSMEQQEDFYAEQEGVPVARMLSNPTQDFSYENAQDVADATRRIEGKRGVQMERLRVNKEAEEGKPITERGKGGATGDVEEARGGKELTDLLPDAASSGKPEPTEPKEIQKEAKGKSKKNPIPVGPGGFVWNKKGHWRDRVKRAMEYVDQPKIFSYIREVEVKTVNKNLDIALRKTGR